MTPGAPTAFAWRAGLLGLLCCAAPLILTATGPSALRGWLAAFAFWTAIPVGGLLLAMMMRLVPGTWRGEFERSAKATLCLLPLAAAASVPVLAGLAALYPRIGDVTRGLYWVPWAFVMRTALFFACTIALSLLLLMRQMTPGLAGAGLVLFVLLDTTVAADWLLSLDAEFHSSGFGLYVLAIQATTAMAVLILLRVARGNASDNGTAGSLLLTSLLLWGYLAFMQYFITWSDNFATGAAWYGRRATGVWSAVEIVVVAIGLGPILLLLFPRIRHARRWLIVLAGATLVGKSLEMGWLVLPAGENGARTAVVTLLSFGGLGALSVACAAGFLASPDRSRSLLALSRRAE